MTAFMRVQHSYVHKNGNIADNVVNSWFFKSETQLVSPAQAAIMEPIIIEFYDGSAAPTSNLRNFINENWMGTLRHAFKVYDMSDPPERVPVYSSNLAGSYGANISSTGLPAEVACCLSYNAFPASGTNQGRRRGRMFIGPLNTTTLFADSNASVRPAVAFTNTLRNNAKKLQDTASTAGWVWCVYSPTTDVVGSLAESYTAIDEVSTDDAFDIQRRRGVSPTARARTTV